MNTIDVTVKPSLPTSVNSLDDTPSFRVAYDLRGVSVGRGAPLHRGTYLVREGKRTKKLIVK